ncbi:hypothetical protein LZ31DRAFT_217832 [Colletotrichum somersetense]|nr:hypothetical protein LZ31DRAFT_217832 [Colletotrichum somersetense]
MGRNARRMYSMSVCLAPSGRQKPQGAVLCTTDRLVVVVAGASGTIFWLNLEPEKEELHAGDYPVTLPVSMRHAISLPWRSRLPPAHGSSYHFNTYGGELSSVRGGLLCGELCTLLLKVSHVVFLLILAGVWTLTLCLFLSFLYVCVCPCVCMCVSPSRLHFGGAS